MSLIQNAALLSLNYTVLSSSCYAENYLPSYALNYSNSGFMSQNIPGSYWQINFSKPVEISSYLICPSTNTGYRPMSWNITSSMDGRFWRLNENHNNEQWPSAPQNKTINFKRAVICKMLRITLVKNYGSTNIMF